MTLDRDKLVEAMKAEGVKAFRKGEDAMEAALAVAEREIRNAVLEEAAGLVNWRIHESSGESVANRFIRLQNDIRAMKEPTNG